MKILHLISSPRGPQSLSRKLGNHIVNELQAKNASAELREHDLTEDRLDHVGIAHLQSFFTPPDQHTEENKRILGPSQRVLDELLGSDVIVISIPMWNFSIPSALKAWVDHACRAGITFRYTAQGPEGLVKGKKVYLAISSGGIYSEGPGQKMDFIEPYLRSVLGFLGMTDVEVLRVEGTAGGIAPEVALSKAYASLRL